MIQIINDSPIRIFISSSLFINSIDIDIDIDILSSDGQDSLLFYSTNSLLSFSLFYF